MKKPDTLDEYQTKLREALHLLVECRDALPAISMASARLHGVSLDLDKRIEAFLEPWKTGTLPDYRP